VGVDRVYPFQEIFWMQDIVTSTVGLVSTGPLFEATASNSAACPADQLAAMCS